MTGQQLYDLYRAERTSQGFAEFKWENLSRTQQIVWERVAKALPR